MDRIKPDVEFASLVIDGFTNLRFGEEWTEVEKETDFSRIDKRTRFTTVKGNYLIWVDRTQILAGNVQLDSDDEIIKSYPYEILEKEEVYKEALKFFTEECGRRLDSSVHLYGLDLFPYHPVDNRYKPYHR
jgi:hypothetical protein